MVIKAGLQIFLVLTIPKAMDFVMKYGTKPTHLYCEGVYIIPLQIEPLSLISF